MKANYIKPQMQALSLLHGEVLCSSVKLDTTTTVEDDNGGWSRAFTGTAAGDYDEE